MYLDANPKITCEAKRSNIWKSLNNFIAHLSFQKSRNGHIDSLANHDLRDLGLDTRQRVEQDPRALIGSRLMGPM